MRTMATPLMVTVFFILIVNWGPALSVGIIKDENRNKIKSFENTKIKIFSRIINDYYN